MGGRGDWCFAFFLLVLCLPFHLAVVMYLGRKPGVSILIEQEMHQHNILFAFL